MLGMRWWWLLIWVGCSSPPAPRVIAAHPAPVPARALAPTREAPPPPEKRLPRTFAPTSHDVSLSVTETFVDGVIRITGTITERTSVVYLHAIDLAIYRVTASHAGASTELGVAMQPASETIALVPDTAFEPGEWTFTIEYRAPILQHGEVELGAYGTSKNPSRGVFAQLVAGKRFTFTQFEPMEARRVFPCIDEPDRKVPWKLSVETSRGELAVSNTVVEQTVERGQRTRYEFGRTRPLPSYLIAFAIGPFEVVDAGRAKSGVPIRFLVPPGHRGPATALATWTRLALDRVEQWTEIPYAYGKLDLVAVPRTGPHWWAMENAGMVTVALPALGDPREFVTTLLHELAHHWFGDLVTMAWFDDVWLNEAFATWLAAKLRIANVPSTPPEPSRPFVHETLPDVSTIRPSLEESYDRRRLAPYIPGDKGARLVEGLERLLGEERFAEAIRGYLRAHADGNATSKDLVAALASTFGQPIEPMIMAALDGGATPVITIRPSCSGKPSLRVEIKRPATPVVTCIAFDAAGKRADRCITIARDPVSIPLATCPRWFLPEPRRSELIDYTFGQAELRPVLDHAWPLLSPGEQALLLDYEWKNPAIDLELATRLADSDDLAARERAGRLLARVAASVPEDLWPAFERRVRAQYTELARSHVDDVGWEGSGALLVLGTIGDPVLASLAASRVKPDDNRIWLYGFAIHDPKTLERFFEKDQLSEVYSAIGRLPNALDLVARHPKLPASAVHRVLSGRCTTQRRDQIQNMAELDDVLRRRALAALDGCLATAKPLEPVLRRWLR